jgi:hypothetical protein
MTRDHYAGVAYFFAGLQLVTAIGKKRRTRGFDQQNCGAAAESAQVADIGQMSDKESVRMVLRK